jgi:hypothetical protein
MSNNFKTSSGQEFTIGQSYYIVNLNEEDEVYFGEVEVFEKKNAYVKDNIVTTVLRRH